MRGICTLPLRPLSFTGWRPRVSLPSSSTSRLKGARPARSFCCWTAVTAAPTAKGHRPKATGRAEVKGLERGRAVITSFTALEFSYEMGTGWSVPKPCRLRCLLPFWSRDCGQATPTATATARFLSMSYTTTSSTRSARSLLIRLPRRSVNRHGESGDSNVPPESGCWMISHLAARRGCCSRRYPAEFRRKVPDRIAAGQPAAQGAHVLEISALCIYTCVSSS